MKKSVPYNELAWPGVKKALAGRWLILPFGSMEQHGPHLPLGTDTVLAGHMAREVAAEIGGVTAPAMEYGGRSLPNSGGGPGYPGGVFFPGKTLIDMYERLIHGYIQNGAEKILLVNAHWENEAFLFEALERAREKKYLESSKIVAASWWNLVSEKEALDIFGFFPGWSAEHAGQAETALMLAYAPEQVRFEKALDHKGHIPEGIYKYPVPKSWTGTNGVLSSTTHVKPEMGKRLSEIIKSRFIALLEDD
ncbi:putative Creatinine amidohydrolase [Candidatus Desulfarcum epimagneticum]|uniref:Putative Creatinine amidohydrolase n=1 Tax=uncultured Desulfobacteraceae bacterium TaxID=218296 RepID=A0A484HLD8_9BACT|nr:putative Creatinine amidohydrolase [uncultured Desulfobacteraceae bacterium]